MPNYRLPFPVSLTATLSILRMSDPATHGEDPGTPSTPTHRARPSIITTASGLAESTLTYGSLMSSDGLARLSQFPPPPPGVPLTPFETAFAGPSSPVASDRSMTPPATIRRALPVPPTPLNIRKRSPSPAGGDAPPSNPPAQPQLPQLNPSFNLATSSSGSAYPSPHDWHDGSSSIANDPYGEDVLSTTLITSLLSQPVPETHDSAPTAGPSSWHRQQYTPSVVSNALTTDSTITYPPPKTFPPPLPSEFKYPPLPIPPVIPRDSSSIDVSSPRALQPPSRGLMSVEGRNTPETWMSGESGHTTQVATSDTLRAMSVTPSMQSMTSSTPLMATFEKGDPILEEEEPKSSGPSSANSRHSRSRSRRASIAHSAKTTKSSVFSLMTRLSHSTADRKSLKQATTSWFRGKPLPPVPPLPDHAFRELQKQEDELPLPDLVNRAAALSSMLDKGHRPYHSMISLEHGSNQSRPPTGNFGQDARYSGADPHKMLSQRGRKNQVGDLSQQQWSQPQDQNASGRSKRLPLSKRRKLFIALAIILLIVCITVGVAVGVTVGEKHSSGHSCPNNLAGASCSLSKQPFLMDDWP